MADGNTQVFDIHLGKTTFRQAQSIFKVYGKTAIFSQSEHEPTIEAYFESVNLGGLSAKIVLNLIVTGQPIKAMLDRAHDARLQPSGARRYELHSDDHARLLDSPIIAITYIPTVRLDEKMILDRFGKADNIQQPAQQANNSIWHYPRIGLSVTFNLEEKTVLQYKVQD
ncbi:hypothetical protein A9Q79_06905 [Methylophaga sp. 42_25_T18]|nr:hypothetical protein A9Q79_06905 [Methylophaga sp. 42_25_T18]OUR87718.1 hypothetical protein A9Q92_03970 [Methylophaga sp. 42_8_T64]